MIALGLACMASGVAIGWWRWAGDSTATVDRKQEPANIAKQPSHLKSESVSQPVSETLRRLTTDLAAMEKLSPKSFASAMVDNWLEYASPDAHLKRGLFLDQCNPERAVEFYLEFKRRKGIPLTQNSGELREFFTMMGKRFGPELTERYLALNPDGIPEIDSHIHGWAMAQPKAAVDWLNGLPANSPLYTTSLKGLVWGLGESNPTTALQVYRNLTAADQKETVWNMTNSVVEKRGLHSLNQLLESATPSERLDILRAAAEHATWRPPAEYVSEMAPHLNVAPFLAKDFPSIANRWVTAAPQEALSWLATNATNDNYAQALSITAQALRNQGLESEVNSALRQGQP